MRHQRDDPGSCSCSSSQCGTNEIDATCMLISSVGLTLAMFVPVQGLLPGLHPERVQRQLDDRLRRHLQHLVPTRNGTSLFTSETHHHFRNASSLQKRLLLVTALPSLAASPPPPPPPPPHCSAFPCPICPAPLKLRAFRPRPSSAPGWPSCCGRSASARSHCTAR